MEQETGAIILAGGKNSRMAGEDKAFLEVEGRPIILRIIGTLKPLVKEIIIVTNTPEKYDNFKVKLVRDESPGMGPLMGIYSGLKASSCEHNFITACDTPFLSAALIEYMIKIRDNYDLLAPRIEGKYHPLFALYGKNCLSVIRKALEEGRLNVRGIFPELNCRFISRQEAERFDKDLLSLTNINTRLELEKARGTKA
ncbi:MAG TPA: molybdenum cofactor guanylyltransferase [Candidatus Omnitrophota bacterium]|nr:molybdenum cofactor guanylyltransferase [Candidatus Omnitrophota bacterium]